MYATLTSWLGPQRPKLREVALADVLPARPGRCYITCSPGQWDAWLSGAYAAGWILLELNEDEEPVRAYQAPAPEWN
jgi:hypothetical protein